jgi:hypothetical protein
VTGQAGWYDVRVNLTPAEPEEVEQTSPHPAAMRSTAGVLGGARKVVAYFAGRRS